MTLAIHRDSTLRKAEKLLRQGRLEAAIGEYARIVDEQPQDLATANTLGDLYLRTGQFESAAALYLRIATHLEAEGFLPRAAALYKKILKVKPDDEPVIARAAELAARQGLLADAKSLWTMLAARLAARGDAAGEAAVHRRLAEIDAGRSLVNEQPVPAAPVASVAEAPVLSVAEAPVASAVERPVLSEAEAAVLSAVEAIELDLSDALAELPRVVDNPERAGQAGAPSPDDERAVLYELGLALEAAGESLRALAVYLELQADAGRYRDVGDRIDRLSTSGMRG